MILHVPVVSTTYPMPPGAAESPFILPIQAAEAQQMVAHATRSLPKEACGVILTDGKNRLLLEGQNVARNPETEFLLDKDTMLAILKHTFKGSRLLAIYHSHPNSGLELSEEDVRLFAPKGKPRYPDTALIVVAVAQMEGGVKTMLCAYKWDDRREVPCFVPARLTVIT